MLNRRTDLALESKELWEESASDQTKLEGVIARDQTLFGFRSTTVEIINEAGTRALCKPIGTYITIELDGIIRREEDAFLRCTNTLREKLKEILHINEKAQVLVVGLGNRAITPDAIGPLAAENTMVTRHLVERSPEYFGDFRQVAVIQSGVLGTTGVESAEMVRAVAQKIRPAAIIAVDALASRQMSRICRTIQIADSGIVPGSGVGNSRAALNAETLGIPVIAVGVPTVVDAGTLAADLMQQAGLGDIDAAKFQNFGGDMIVTPKEIDTNVRDIAKIIGYGINLALHEELSISDVDMFLS